MVSWPPRSLSLESLLQLASKGVIPTEGRNLRGCVRSLGHVLEWRYETQTIPQRRDRRTVGCSGLPTPISQDRGKATYCRPTGGRQRHCDTFCATAARGEPCRMTSRLGAPCGGIFGNGDRMVHGNESMRPCGPETAISSRCCREDGWSNEHSRGSAGVVG